MTKKAAAQEAMKRWGRDARLRHSPKAMTEADKAPFRARMAELRAAKTPENKPERDHLLGQLLSYRCEVGELSGVGGFTFFCVRGSGDTWEQAFAQADRR